MVHRKEAMHSGVIPVLFAGVEVRLDPVEHRRPQDLCSPGTLLAADVHDEPFMVLFRCDELYPLANLLSNSCLVCLVVLTRIVCPGIKKKKVQVWVFDHCFLALLSLVGAIPRN